MAAERQAPDAILEQTNLSGTVADIDDDPDSPDASWLTASSNNADSVVRTSFPTPTGNPTAGAGLQEFRVQVRKISGQTGDPTARIELYENGTLVATPLGDTTVTSEAGVVLSGTWDASLLGTADGSLVECRVYGTKTGGAPAARNTLEVGAVEWNVEYSTSAPVTVTPDTASLTTSTFAPTVTASDHQTVTPGPAALTTASFAPTVTATDNQSVTPGTASLALSAFAPTVTATAHVTATPGTASLALTGFAPTVTGGAGLTVTPDKASLTTSTFAPSVTATAHVTVTPDTTALSLATFAPTVSTGAAVTVEPGVASLTTTTFAPGVTVSDNIVVTPSVLALNLSAFAPTVTVTEHVVVRPATASLAITGLAPTVTGDPVEESQGVARRAGGPIGGMVVVGPAKFKGRSISVTNADEDENAQKRLVTLTTNITSLGAQITAARGEGAMSVASPKAELTSRARTALPDSAFACLEKRLYPHHKADGSLDLPHLRNALSRIGDLSNDQCGKKHLMTHKAVAGIGDTAGPKALMPMTTERMDPEQIDGFFAGKLPWRVLAVPFGGPIPSPKAPRGVDLDNQWFSERTDIYGGYAALKADRERLVDWHHGYDMRSFDGRRGDPTGVMNGVALGKAILDRDPSEDGWWADFWARQGEARLSKIRRLVERGVQLFGSGQPTHVLDTEVDHATGEITRFPLLLETISTSPQNTYAVVRPKALLDDLDAADVAVSGAMRDLLTELDALGAELPLSFSKASSAEAVRSGEVAVTAEGVLSPAGQRALDSALAAWREIPDTLR